MCIGFNPVIDIKEGEGTPLDPVVGTVQNYTVARDGGKWFGCMDCVTKTNEYITFPPNAGPKHRGLLMFTGIWLSFSVFARNILSSTKSQTFLWVKSSTSTYLEYGISNIYKFILWFIFHYIYI